MNNQASQGMSEEKEKSLPSSSVKSELQFIADIKQRFTECNQLERYHQFCRAIHGFIHGEISRAEVAKLANILFQGHEDLHKNFLNCLPEELREINSKEFEDIKQNRREHNLALVINFFFKVGHRLGPQSHESFLKTISDWKENPIEVYEVINELFRNHADLIQEFEEVFMEEVWGFKYRSKSHIEK